MKRNILFFVLFYVGIVLSDQALAQTGNPIVVRIDQPTSDIQSTMWGIFFEDINLAADGGIYAELVKNRSFEFAKPLMGWKILKKDPTEGLLILNRSATNEANPRFVRIARNGTDEKFGLENEGFRGMGIKKGMSYHFSVLARNAEESLLKLRLELVSEKGEIIGTANLAPEKGDWKRYSADITATATDSKSKLDIWFEGSGALDIDMISLFPDDTWKNRPGGLRADLVQLLADLKPGFVRFPGGCIVEGFELATRYQWKNTIGNIDARKTMINRWNTEFKHRLTPDYYQSFGMGFFEYFLLAEDIGAEPLPILSCGMACQYNSAEVAPMDQLGPYIQDALDLVEFANGAADTGWGKIRASMGHPAPFNMKMMGIGNEQWGAQYIERYEAFVKAIKSKYPEIKLVTGTGPSPNGKFFDYASKELKRLQAEVVDEHYYASPEWFLQNATRYDHYDRNSYKIFAGEYAAQSKSGANPDNKNNWRCAIAEAAFMTGLERNADVVHLCSYAPLLAHVDGWQWTPDLIWFDNLKSFGTANYYVQKMFSNNRGTNVLSVTQDNQPLTGKDGIYASAVFDSGSGEIILKLVNTTGNTWNQRIILDGKKGLNPKAFRTVLESGDPEAVNSLERPLLISPANQVIYLTRKTMKVILTPSSFSVIKIKLAR
ncbi:MAG: alpha-L-arabinofuranosidase C-terminal domain-containing protein [Prolixibacteraceae bacterium]